MASIASISHAEEKLKWAYKLYDLKRTGGLQKDELVAVLSDSNIRTPMDHKHMSRVINDKTVKNQSNITLDEFISAVKHCPQLMFPCEHIISHVRERVFDREDGWNRNNRDPPPPDLGLGDPSTKSINGDRSTCHYG